jgi:hypothetical protein
LVEAEPDPVQRDLAREVGPRKNFEDPPSSSEGDIAAATADPPSRDLPRFLAEHLERFESDLLRSMLSASCKPPQ